jgi:aspartyl-tRNA synthetase
MTTLSAGLRCTIRSPRRSGRPAALAADPGAALAKADDCVLDGLEIGGGSVRIDFARTYSRPSLAYSVSRRRKPRPEVRLPARRPCADGAPPHGGIAFGLDRLIMLMSGADSIREVIAFPKTQTAFRPLTEAPTPVQRAAAERSCISA